MIFKEVRLRALLDSPTAFSSTFAKESTLTDDDWVARVAQRSSGTSTTYLALDGENACGIASGSLDQGDATLAHLFAMWVAPSHRCMGIGRSLVEAVLAWARAKNVQTMQLLVTSNNDTAIQFYRRLGFTLTGYTSTYANDPALKDYELVRSLC